ncbi:large ribosomal subunit protein mL50-like [Glandiceps talaboti]
MAASMCALQRSFARNSRCILNNSYRVLTSQPIIRHYADNIDHRERSWLKKLMYGSAPASDDVDETDPEVVEAKYMAIPGVQEKPFIIARPKVVKKVYKPSGDVHDQLESITKSLHPDTDDWRNVGLTDPLLKYKILTECIEAFRHAPTSYQLNDLKSVNDVLAFYQTEVKDTTAFDELSHQDLPKNLKINW